MSEPAGHWSRARSTWVWTSALTLGIVAACRETTPATECEPVAPYHGALVARVDVGLLYATAPLPQLSELPSATAERIDAVFAASREDDVEAIAAAILTDDGEYWSSGAQRFWWGSIGKSFTAMLVLELQEQNKLDLLTPVTELVPELELPGEVTIDHLLTHTSGLSNNVGGAGHRQQEWMFTPPGELIARGVDEKPIQCSGSAWKYSSIGYLVLGLAVESVEQRPHHEVMNETLLSRLGQTSLAAIGPGTPPEDVALPTGEPPANITTPFAAGAIVGSALDMAIAWKSFLSGTLISRDNVEVMFAELHSMGRPGHLYGRGVAVYVLPGGELLIAHNGVIDGARAHVSWSWRHRAVVAVALTGKGDPKDIGVALLEELQRTR